MDNPVVALCLEGMDAEGGGRPQDARDLFTRAWEARRDDYDACVAAHYLARRQDSPEDALRWNAEALERARAVGDDRVNGFYPSLYLNLGRSHEDVGDRAEARRCYELAAERLGDLPAGGYGDHVRRGVGAGLDRTA